MGLKRLMLDSGAFSVWNRGSTIDLDRYIAFCQEHPQTSYYVNLDVIPGSPGKIHTMTAKNLEAACVGGWENWKRMVAVLPMEKVIPVFHQNDDPRWIGRYLDAGVTYLGISPANDRTTPQKLDWLTRIRPYLCDRAGNPRVHTHGFAVTSYRLMRFWHWHSVDSASWIRQAGVGGVYVPDATGRYDQSPLNIYFSPKSPARTKRNEHYLTLSPNVRARVDAYVADELRMPIGRYEVLDVPAGYKLDKTEQWFDKTKTQVVRKLEDGLMTNHQFRFLANMRFLQKANEVLPVDHLYFAGSGPAPRIERDIGRRLLSYHEIETSPNTLRLFHKHLERLDPCESSV